MRRSAVIILLLSIAALVWFLKKPDDSAVIKKLLAHAATLSSFDVNEHPFERLAAAEKISELFAEEARFVLATTEEEEEYVLSKQEIKERVLAVRNTLAQLAVTITEVKVTVTEDSAEATAVGSAMGREPDREDYFLEKHPVKIELQRVEDIWKISAARNTDLIEK